MIGPYLTAPTATVYVIDADTTRETFVPVTTTCAPAPASWRLRDGLGADRSSLLFGSGGSRTFTPDSNGGWVVEVLDATGALVASRQVAVQRPDCIVFYWNNAPLYIVPDPPYLTPSTWT